VTGGSAGAHAVELTENTDATADVRGVPDAPTDAHPPVLSAANDDHFVIRRTRSTERLRMTVLTRRLLVMTNFCTESKKINGNL